VEADGKGEQDSSQGAEAKRERKSREKRERALKEREGKVKADLERLDIDIDRSRMGLNKEEGEQLFRCALSSCSHPVERFVAHLRDISW